MMRLQMGGGGGVAGCGLQDAVAGCGLQDADTGCL